jgi:hypothetical protein
MNDNFLPEEDQDFLRDKQITYELLREGSGPDAARGVLFTGFQAPNNLFASDNGALVPAPVVDLMVPIPKGYAKTRLDSWYVWPRLYLANGQMANRADSETSMFNRTWQFWSRHLADGDWREGDGFETYLQYIKSGLRNP